jgi:hypothetical protein
VCGRDVQRPVQWQVLIGCLPEHWQATEDVCGPGGAIQTCLYCTCLPSLHPYARVSAVIPPPAADHMGTCWKPGLVLPMQGGGPHQGPARTWNTSRAVTYPPSSCLQYFSHARNMDQPHSRYTLSPVARHR